MNKIKDRQNPEKQPQTLTIPRNSKASNNFKALYQLTKQKKASINNNTLPSQKNNFSTTNA